MPSQSSSLPTSKAEAPRLSKHIVGLDALRMIAACIVMAGHLTYVMWLDQPPLPAIALATEPFVWFGWVGVEIFFVLSGFVIAYSAYGLASSTASTPPHTIFLHHRLKRLVPAAFICSIFTAIVLLIADPMPKYRVALDWVRTMTFLPQGPWPILHIPLVDQSYWTLTLEAVFYAIVYFLLRFKRIDKLPAVMAALGAISSVHWILFFVAHRHAVGIARWDYPVGLHALANMTLLADGCYFTIGVFLWLCLFRGVTWQRIALLALCIAGGVLQIIHRWYAYSATSIRIPVTLAVALWLLSLVLIVAFTLANKPVQLALGRHGSLILRRVGLMTYPLYLVHQEFGKQLINAIRGRVGDWSAAGIAIVCSLLIAYIVSKFLEPPAQRILLHIMTRKSRPEIPSQVANAT